MLTLIKGVRGAVAGLFRGIANVIEPAKEEKPLAAAAQAQYNLLVSPLEKALRKTFGPDNEQTFRMSSFTSEYTFYDKEDNGKTVPLEEGSTNLYINFASKAEQDAHNSNACLETVASAAPAQPFATLAQVTANWQPRIGNTQNAVTSGLKDLKVLVGPSGTISVIDNMDVRNGDGGHWSNYAVGYTGISQKDLVAFTLAWVQEYVGTQQAINLNKNLPKAMRLKIAGNFNPAGFSI